MTTKIGVIAERLGTTVRTLRFYEERGLVHPHRSPKGTRLYDEEQEARAAADASVRRAREALDAARRVWGAGLRRGPAVPV